MMSQLPGMRARIPTGAVRADGQLDLVGPAAGERVAVVLAAPFDDQVVLDRRIEQSITVGRPAPVSVRSSAVRISKLSGTAGWSFSSRSAVTYWTRVLSSSKRSAVPDAASGSMLVAAAPVAKSVASAAIDEPAPAALRTARRVVDPPSG
jgi:hypothetical protein